MEAKEMASRATKIKPEEFILSALSKNERINAALTVAGEAFKHTDLSMDDIDNAVKAIRKKEFPLPRLSRSNSS